MFDAIRSTVHPSTGSPHHPERKSQHWIKRCSTASDDLQLEPLKRDIRKIHSKRTDQLTSIPSKACRSSKAKNKYASAMRFDIRSIISNERRGSGAGLPKTLKALWRSLMGGRGGGKGDLACAACLSARPARVTA